MFTWIVEWMTVCKTMDRSKYYCVYNPRNNYKSKKNIIEIWGPPAVFDTPIAASAWCTSMITLFYFCTEWTRPHGQHTARHQDGQQDSGRLKHNAPLHAMLHIACGAHTPYSYIVSIFFKLNSLNLSLHPRPPFKQYRGKATLYHHQGIFIVYTQRSYTDEATI